MGYYSKFNLSYDGIVTNEDKKLMIDFLADLNNLDKDEARCLIEGVTIEAKWYEVKNDLEKLSAVFPNILFHLEVQGEDMGDFWELDMFNGDEIDNNENDIDISLIKRDLIKKIVYELNVLKVKEYNLLGEKDTMEDFHNLPMAVVKNEENKPRLCYCVSLEFFDNTLNVFCEDIEKNKGVAFIDIKEVSIESLVEIYNKIKK